MEIFSLVSHQGEEEKSEAKHNRYPVGTQNEAKQNKKCEAKWCEEKLIRKWNEKIEAEVKRFFSSEKKSFFISKWKLRTEMMKKPNLFGSKAKNTIRN
jgi:hypothetical protein